MPKDIVRQPTRESLRRIAAHFVPGFPTHKPPTKSVSCTTSAYFGSPRGLVSYCKTYPCLDTVEVWGSSPHGPTIVFNTLESFLRNPRETSPVNWAVCAQANRPASWIPLSML